MTATLAPPSLAPEAVSPPAPAVETGGSDRRRSLGHRLWRGPETDPAWARPVLLGLLAATALLYLWGLGAQGWANTYYSAAVQAGTQSWKAFFFGSTDASNFITVDKTPLSLWPMEISARIFGVNAWSILVPQALMGVATVGLTYAAVKRWFGAAAGLIAGVVIATTPVAALMFRFNNPDASLTLLMTCGAYAMTRALERDSTRWIVAAGASVGLAFLAKELQAFLVLPAFGLAYLIAGPPQLGRRVWQVILLGLSTLVAGGWWVAIVSLWPASSRPYIGGSQNNSFFNVLFGYNGFGRLTGDETGSVGGQPTGAGGVQWGPTGWTRLFNDAFGGQASWLIPAALILGVTVLGWTLLHPRTDRTRAAMVLWGGWLFFTGAAISLGKGIIHEYYTVALAPAIGAVVGIGAVFLWQRREHAAARVAMGVSVIVSAWWAAELLDRTPTWMPGLHDLVLIAGVFVGLVLIFPITITRVALSVALVALVLCLLAPTTYTLSTIRQSQGGAIPLAGPAGQGGRFARGGPGGAFGPPGGFQGGTSQFPGGGNGTFPAPGGTGGGPGGGMGGLLNGSQVGDELSRLLQDGSDGYRWTAAAIGANNAASYQLASGEAIMAIGGFNGSDPAPSLAQFQEYVRDGKVHYFIAGGGFGGGGFGPGANTSSGISTWVTQNFTSRTVDGVTIYDLTQPRSSSGSANDAV